MSTEVRFVSAFERREELIPLYEEYSAMLLRANPGFGASLAQQNYDEEIAHLVLEVQVAVFVNVVDKAVVSEPLFVKFQR